MLRRVRNWADIVAQAGYTGRYENNL